MKKQEIYFLDSSILFFMKSEKSVIFHFENSFFDTEIHITDFFDFSSQNKIIKLFVVSKNFLQ